MISFLAIGLIAQKGTVRGTLYDTSTGEPLPFGNVMAVGTDKGTTTDLDGTYAFQLEPGTYSLEFTFLGYTPTVIEGVEVKTNEVSVVNGRLSEDAKELETVVITARQARNTEAALATLQRKSINVIDGISASSFKKSGDSDAASAVKRVPGVSVEGGKYVYVRGLGDRYTKSTLNGMDIPGLDPDRNSLQMDIFPTNILDNIIVKKSFTADLPADFTGGVVDISTKDFPERKTFGASIGIGYNPNMHLNSNYLSYQGGSTDFLGFDDGTRNIPTNRRERIPRLGDALSDPNGRGQDFMRILNDFNPTLGAMRTQSFMDFNAGISGGNQINKENVTYGYNYAISYKNNTEYFDNVAYKQYGINSDASIFELDAREIQTGEIGKNNVLVSGLAGFSIKTTNSKYRINALHIQNGESTAGIFDLIKKDEGNNFKAKQHNLEYSERTLSNMMLIGNHNVGEGQWKIDWRASGTRSSITDPDIRFTRIRNDGPIPVVGTESGIPARIWRFLEEYSMDGKIDVQKQYALFNNPAEFKFGAGYTYKTRDFEVQDFQFPTQQAEITNDPNDILRDENLWSPENNLGVIYQPLFIPFNPNKFDAQSSKPFAYVSTEINPFSKLKAIIGLRAEQYTQYYTGINQDRKKFNDEKVLDDLDLFPTTNLIYSITDMMNLRLSYTRTIARPSFKEASFATILDPITNRTFIGGFFSDVDPATGKEIWNGKLTKTDIDNIDLRWEMFQQGGQIFSISGFYKHFTNPIEIVQYIQAPNNFQPRNVGDGMVLGGEIELRQNLAKLSKVLTDITFNVNLTLTESSIEMSEAEFLSRKENARKGQEIERRRDMAGQAPYLINSGLTYSNPDNGWTLGAYYNVQGPTLQFVGVADRPDIYTVPFHSLNLSVSKAFGTENRWKASLQASNLLNDTRESVFQNYKADDQLFSSIQPQRSFSLGLSYSL